MQWDLRWGLYEKVFLLLNINQSAILLGPKWHSLNTLKYLLMPFSSPRNMSDCIRLHHTSHKSLGDFRPFKFGWIQVHGPKNGSGESASALDLFCNQGLTESTSFSEIELSDPWPLILDDLGHIPIRLSFS